MTSRRRSNIPVLEPGAGISSLNDYDLALIKQALTVPSVTSVPLVGPSEQTQKRLAVKEMMDSPDFKPNFCNFDYIHAFVPMKKSSASNTSVFFGDVTINDGPSAVPVGHTNEVDVSVKLAMKERLLKSDNSLSLERINYQMIANTIILNEWSPHIVAYVASFECPTQQTIDLIPNDSVASNIIHDLRPKFDEMVTIEDEIEELKRMIQNDKKLLDDGYLDQDTYDLMTKDLNEKIKELEQDLEYDVNNLDFLITEKATNSMPLKTWVEATRTEQELKSVLFQTLYTLEVFNRIGFRHNDAHSKNVLIENLSHTDMPEKSSYNIDGVVFNVSNKNHFVKFFDFDRSSFSCDPKTIHPDYVDLITEYQKELAKHGMDACTNTLLTGYLCNNYGQCNDVNYKYDTMLTLKALMSSMKASKERDWILQQISGAFKHLNPPNKIWLKAGYTPTDQEMPSTLQMLKSDFFSDLRSNSPSKQIYYMPKKPINYPK